MLGFKSLLCIDFTSNVAFKMAVRDLFRVDVLVSNVLSECFQILNVFCGVGICI